MSKQVTIDKAADILGVAPNTMRDSKRSSLIPSPAGYVGTVAVYNLDEVLEVKRQRDQRRKDFAEPTLGGERVYTVAQVAAELGVTRAWIYSLIAKGEIEPLRQFKFKNRMVLTVQQVNRLRAR